MSDTAEMGRKREGPPGRRRPLVDDELADQLLGRAQAEGVELLGPDGLLSQVTKAVLERALAEEMTGHLGYEKHDPAGRGSGNSRNGATPQDRADRRRGGGPGGAPGPQRDLRAADRAQGPDPAGGVQRPDHRACMRAGMTTRDIRAHLREMYDVDVSPDLISRVTDGVLEELAEWQSRPLDRGLPGDLHRRADGEDQGRGGHQPAGLPGHRDRLRGRQAGPGPVGRAHDWANQPSSGCRCSPS